MSLVLVLAACAPVLDDDTPYVTGPRVLAVRAEPAEVEAGAEIVLTALYADETGALARADLDWSFCPVPSPLAELGPISRDCLAPDADDLVPIGTGLSVTGVVPQDACSRFGPNPPPPREGQPPGRPADPDITGGFYQPALVFENGQDGDPTLIDLRVRCGLANVAQETYIAWNQAYLSNRNPRVEGLVLGSDGGDELPPEETGIATSVRAGETFALTVRWPACDDADAACDGAETYVVHDPETDALPERREAISATWFTTAGLLDTARNGRVGDDESRTLSNGWTAPDAPGEVWVGVVLRDERGGIDFASYRLEVAEP
jgi:hypothetical protein